MNGKINVRLTWSMHVLLFVVGILWFQSCSNKSSTGEVTGQNGDSTSVLQDTSGEKALPSENNNGGTNAIKDSLLRSFVEEFSSTNSFPIIVDKDLYDSSKVIPDEMIVKCLKNNDIYYYNKWYFGSRFVVGDSIYGLIYHYLYKFVPDQIWIPGSEYVGSNIVYINNEGKEIGSVTNAYYSSEGSSENGEDYEKHNLTSLMKEGELFLSKSEKTKQVEDGELGSYEEIKSSTYYSWNNQGELVEGETKIDGHVSDKINPAARKSLLDSLKEVKNITFVGVIKQNEEYYRINPNCVAASELKIIDTSEELKASNFSLINERYLPIWVDENNEYSATLITNLKFNPSTEQYSFNAKSFEIFRDDYPVIKLNQEGNEIDIIRSDKEYWMIKADPEEDRLYMDETFASKLPVSDYSCDQ